MVNSSHAETFASRPVRDFDPDQGIADPADITYRLSVDWDAAEEGVRIVDRIAAFVDDLGATEATGLVIGVWEMAYENDARAAIDALVGARQLLPSLEAIFLGDITIEESEISWIHQADVSPLLRAYPNLRHFRVRGGEGLAFGHGIELPQLESLVVETGGMDRGVLHAIGDMKLPRLEHLELWLGEENYGWNGTVDDLKPILEGGRFPRLRYLGLRDSEISDAIAAALVTSPVLEQIEILDLSLGTLGDDGARALAGCPATARLEKLDIHHHFVSKGALGELRAIGISIDDADEQEVDDGYRYVAVGE